MDSTSLRSFMEGTGGGNGGGAGRVVCSSGESHMSHFGSVGTLAKSHEAHTIRLVPARGFEAPVAIAGIVSRPSSHAVAEGPAAASDDVIARLPAGGLRGAGRDPTREHPHSRCPSLCASS